MAFLDSTSKLQEPISEGRLAMIDVGDDGKVPDSLRWKLAQIYAILFISLLARL